MKLSSLGTRWAGWGLMAATFAMGASLILTSSFSYRSAIAASAAVSRSQGDAFVRSLLMIDRRSGDLVAAGGLAAFLDEQAPAGLRYVALYDEARDRLVEEAGSPVAGRAGPAPDRNTAEMQKVGPRMRLVARPPAPPPSSPEARAARAAPARRGPPAITVEFEPLLAAQLSADAVRALRFSAAAAAGLLLVAALFSRLLMQREAAERRFEERRRLAALGRDVRGARARAAQPARLAQGPRAAPRWNAARRRPRAREGRAHRARGGRGSRRSPRDLLDFVALRRRSAGPRPTPLALLRAAADSIGPSRVRILADGALARFAPRHRRACVRSSSTCCATRSQASPAGAPAEVRRCDPRRPARLHGARPRRGAPAGRGGAHLRAVLHHARQGHRPRAGRRPPHRRAARRHHHAPRTTPRAAPSSRSRSRRG